MKLFNRRLTSISVLMALAMLLGGSGRSAAAMKKQVIHSFGVYPDGQYPQAPLVIGKNGILYGTTSYGGGVGSILGNGTVFSLTPPSTPGAAWGETVLYAFTGGADGATPFAGLVVGTDGVLYGTTNLGGAHLTGTAFSLSPPAAPGGAWTETVLHTFGGPGDGDYPSALVMGTDGTLYGTTVEGGGSGIAFALIPPATSGGAWNEKVLFNFSDLPPGSGFTPGAGLAIGPDGTLYGATFSGGMFNQGTAFALTPPSNPSGQWTETTLYSFGAFPGDGTTPDHTLVLGKNGVLYGSAGGGSASPPCGVVFSLAPPASAGGAWQEKIIRSFTRGADGCNPGELLLGENGTLFGTTFGPAAFRGGVRNGTLFALKPPTGSQTAWSEVVLPFTGSPDGANPVGGLIMDNNGTLYGTTYTGGTQNLGTAFEVTR